MHLSSFAAVVAALTFAAPSSAPSQTEAVSDETAFPAVVARVNGTEISNDELVRRGAALKSQIPAEEVGPDFYQLVLEDLIGGELLFQSVQTKGIAPSDTEVDDQYGQQAERFGGLIAFESALTDEGLTAAEIKRDIKKEMSIRNLVEQELVPDIVVSEEDKRVFYEGNADSMPQPAEFRAAHILISVPEDAPDAQKEEGRKKATAIRSMVEMGQDFGELAARNSGDPGSKDNGGELPWMAEGQTVPPFEAAMKSLAPGEMSGVVETQFGFHIIRLLDKRGGGAMPYEEVQERIEDFLKRKGLQERIQQEIETLRALAAVEVFI